MDIQYSVYFNRIKNEESFGSKKIQKFQLFEDRGTVILPVPSASFTLFPTFPQHHYKGHLSVGQVRASTYLAALTPVTQESLGEGNVRWQLSTEKEPLRGRIDLEREKHNLGFLSKPLRDRKPSTKEIIKCRKRVLKKLYGWPKTQNFLRVVKYFSQ